jgi:hypothetical protein
MRLSASVISKGKYYKAGEEIPENLLSDALRKYEVTDDYTLQQQRRDADDIESKPALPRRPRNRNRVASFVKRGEHFEPASKVDVIPGEILYWHRRKSFGVTEKFIAFGRVGSE